jgi:hypothetical protein
MATSYELSPRKGSTGDFSFHNDQENNNNSDLNVDDEQLVGAGDDENNNESGNETAGEHVHDGHHAAVSPERKEVDVTAIQGNIGAALTRAFDLSQFVSAFDNIFTVFNDQGNKISNVVTKVTDLRADTERAKESLSADIHSLANKEHANAEAIRSLRHALHAKMESEQLLTEQLIAMQDELGRATNRLAQMEDKLFDLTTKQELMQSQLESMPGGGQLSQTNSFLNSRPLTGHSMDLFTASAASPKLLDFRSQFAPNASQAASTSGRSTPATLSRRNSNTNRPQTPQDAAGVGIAQRRSFRGPSPSSQTTPPQTAASDVQTTGDGFIVNKPHTPIQDGHMADVVFATQVAIMAANAPVTPQLITHPEGENEDDASAVASLEKPNADQARQVEQMFADQADDAAAQQQQVQTDIDQVTEVSNKFPTPQPPADAESGDASAPPSATDAEVEAIQSLPSGQQLIPSRGATPKDPSPATVRSAKTPQPTDAQVPVQEGQEGVAENAVTSTRPPLPSRGSSASSLKAPSPAPSSVNPRSKPSTPAPLDTTSSANSR